MFGRKKKATLVESSRSLKVAGTSYRQDDLRKIAGKKTKEGHDLPVVAALVPHPSNEHDPNAVSVQIDGLLVGYLSRDEAKKVQPALLDFHQRTKTHVAVNAKVIGGKKVSRKEETNYGVRVYFNPADLPAS